MSSESQSSSGASDSKASGSAENLDTNSDTTGGGESRKDHVAYDTYRKVLGEKKAQDAKLKELQARIDEVEAQKMQAEGNKDQLIAKLQKQLNEQQKEYKQMQGNYAYNQITSQVKQEAIKLGCIDPDALIRLADITSLEVDESFNVDKSGVQALIDDLKKSKAYLFKKDVGQIADGTPSGKVPNNKPDLKKMSRDEIIAALAAKTSTSPKM